MNTNVKELITCVACGSEDLFTVLDLGTQPLANSYKLNKDDIQEEYPLAINKCNHCHHVQLTHAVNPDLMFNDYLYVSGTSQTGREHFKQIVDYVTRNNASNHQLKILDIGCNDGTQLDYFKEKQYDTYGVDPAQNLFEISSKNHKIWCDYFTQDFAKEINTTFDILIAQNVFAHTADPLEFLNAAKIVMNKNSKLYIQTSQANMILNNEFDTIYHEHISFFCVNSMNALCKRANMKLENVMHVPIHGTSFLFEISLNETIDNTENVKEFIEIEKSNGIYDTQTYIDYAKNCKELVKELKYITDLYQSNEISFFAIGYGAAAKGMTLLNFSKIKLDYIVDDNPLKQGRFTPGSSIPIVSSEHLKKQTGNVIFVPLAWNFFDEIKSRIKKIRNNQWDVFCTYFPKVNVE